MTLDLNGFTVSSIASPAGGYGIALAANGLSDIIILNGHIHGGVTNTGTGSYSGPGFQHGISYTGTTPAAVQVSQVSVSGCAGSGINLGGGFFANASIARDCMVKTVQSGGIAADVISGCTAIDCGGTAIAGGVVTSCRGESTGTGFGVFGNVVENSQGTANTSDGVYGTMLHNCFGTSTNGIGVHALTSAEHCYGRTTGGTAGVNAPNALFCTGNRSGGTANQGFCGHRLRGRSRYE